MLNGERKKSKGPTYFYLIVIQLKRKFHVSFMNQGRITFHATGRLRRRVGTGFNTRSTNGCRTIASRAWILQKGLTSVTFSCCSP